MTQSQIKETETFNTLLKKLGFPIDHLAAEELQQIMNDVFTGNAGRLTKWETEERILTYLVEICADNSIKTFHQLLDYYRKKSAQLFGSLYISEALEDFVEECGSEEYRQDPVCTIKHCSAPVQQYPMVLLPEHNAQFTPTRGTEDWEVETPNNPACLC